MFTPYPALCPGPGLPQRIPLVSPLGSTSSANRGAPRPLFEGFPATMGLSDFPHSFTAVVLLADSQRGPRCHSWPNAGSPGSRVSLFRACAGSRTTRGRNSSCDNDLFRVAFRDKRRRQPPEVILLSRLNTRPTRYPVNASPLPLRATTHDSGPMWFATPSSDGTCTRKTYRFVPAHFAVGTALTGGPPHRSRRAALPHRAPTSSHDAQSLFRIRM